MPWFNAKTKKENLFKTKNDDTDLYKKWKQKKPDLYKKCKTFFVKVRLECQGQVRVSAFCQVKVSFLKGHQCFKMFIF